MERNSMDTASRDGQVIVVGDDDAGEFQMAWDVTFENGLFPGKFGFWVTIDQSFSWGEHYGFGPSYWREIEDG